jgi:opacity protein-like surface antigen
MVGLVAVQEAWALKPHKREGVIFGVAVGTSQGQVNLFPGSDYSVSSDWEQGVSPEIRLGYAVIKNRLLVTVANQQWLYEQGVLAEDKLRINTQNWSLDLTFCPGNPNSGWGGIYVKAGIGYANSRLTILEPIEEDEHGNTFEEVYKTDEYGTAYTVGIGYELRLAKSLAAGLAVSYIHQPIEGDIFDDSTFIPTNLTLNWYW